MKLLILIIFIILSVLYDRYRIKNGGINKEQHVYRWFFRALIIGLISLGNFKDFIALGLIFAGLWDNSLNYAMGWSWFNLGITAKWDIFWIKHYTAYKVIILSSLILGVTLYFI